MISLLVSSHMNWNTRAAIRRRTQIGVAKKLLPDILSYDPRRLGSFPHNGRKLTDDVCRRFLSILTNGKVTGDKVGPHSDLLGEFPYLGPPHD